MDSMLDTLGDYLIVKELGEGPFGKVYLGEHRFIKELFALKVLPEEIPIQDPSFARRFEEEVSKLAALEHPHILKIHNISCREGLYFFVTDPIIDSKQETMDLGRYLDLKGAALCEEERLDLAKQIASALDYAHGQGVFHGGLKLSNIFVTLKGDRMEVLLADFGLSRLLGEGVFFSRLSAKMAAKLIPPTHPVSEAALKAARRFTMDFLYLAPEQRGVEPIESWGPVDSYAFGMVVLSLLGGKQGIVQPVQKLLPHAKGNWDLLIQSCLQLEPQMRPKELSAALEVAAREIPPSLDVMKPLSHIEPLLQMDLFPSAEKDPLKPLLKPASIARPTYEEDPAALFQRELTVSQYTPKKVELDEIEPMLTEMIIVPGGTYSRGSNEGARDEMPRHFVHIGSFALDIHPVTNEQFIRFLQAMGGEKDHNNNDIIRLRDSRIKKTAGKLTIESGYAKHPVVGVSWYGALAYAKWVGKRLPREVEWEVAASGGKEGYLYPTGAEIERSQANFFSSDTTAVMSYPPNVLGLYDMAGNVYDWCQDWYAYNYYDLSALEPDQPTGPQQGVYRVLRGGCWKSLKEDLRCSHRHRNNPGAVNGTYGFRCAADVAVSG